MGGTGSDKKASKETFAQKRVHLCGSPCKREKTSPLRRESGNGRGRYFFMGALKRPSYR